MEKLVNPQKTIEIIKKYDFNFQKRFGQNFLIDERVVSRIIEAADPGSDDYVMEIGPGIGTLTQFLAERAKAVAAIEIDRSLIPILNETLAEYDNVTIINEDVMKLDLPAFVQEFSGGRPVSVAANLPYYITTPIIMKLFESGIPLKRITVMVQKEVAMRMQAGPGTKDYGALSLAVGYYADAKIAANVPQNCFIPRPAVGSAVITLDCYDTPPVTVKDKEQMFALIHAAFGQRRKTLANAAGNNPALPFDRNEITLALREEGLGESVRGEALTLEQFALLSDRLTKIKEEREG